MPKLPGLGEVKKGHLIAFGVVGVVVGGYVILRRRNTVPAPGTTATDTTATDPNAIDPATGIPYAQEYGGAGGYYGGGGQYGQPPPVPGSGGFTTNGQWAQQAEQDLSGVGVDPTTLAAALGKYLTGQAVTSDQHSLVNQAIAFENYPPVAGPGGYPPAVRDQPFGKPPPRPPHGRGQYKTVHADGHRSLDAYASANSTSAQQMLKWASDAGHHYGPAMSKYIRAHQFGKAVPHNTVLYVSYRPPVD